MTKNGSNSLNKRTVTVLSQDGEPAGLTYPKRAAGLVRKGRARFVNDNTIRLEYSVSDVTNITEDIKMDNINNLSELSKLSKPGEIGEPAENTGSKQQESPAAPEQPINRLFFNAREWSFNKDCKNNVGSRSFMQGPDGTINEAFTIGDWSHNWTEIVTKSLILPKHTLHTFTFWLNGGENDQNDEVCRLEIIFNNDWENRYTFNLNRNFIKPQKKCRGWELYEIPFFTADNEYTQLRFVAQRAYMTVMNAKTASEYANLPDTPDEFEGERPQRHNIVFDDGFPTNTWYSTRNLRNRKPQKSGKAFNSESVLPDELKPLVESLPPDEKANLIRDIMKNRSAANSAKPPKPAIPPIPDIPPIPAMPGYSAINGEAKSELIGMILNAGLPVEIANTLLTDLIGPDGKLSKGMIENILKKQSLSEETAERLKRLNEKIAEKISALQTIPDNAETVAREMNSLNAAVSDISGRISSMVEELTGSLSEEISMHVQNAVESALNDAADDDSDIDPDDIADTVVSQFEDRITDLTDAITDSLNGLSDQISDAIDELNDRLDELSDD